MKSQIRSRILGWDFEKEIDGLNFSRKELMDVIQEELWDLYLDILSSSSLVVPQGSFVESEIYDRVCGNAKEYITSNQNRWEVEYTLVDNSGNERQTELINITELLLDMLGDDSSTGEFDARLSGYVENCLLEFVKNSTWHIENDCLWFGIDKPLSAWLINSEMDQEDLAFWFEADSWSIMSHLGDFSDSFLIWYTAECGCWTPDMSDISSSCPVQFEETDTIESILQKVETWCSENNIEADAMSEKRIYHLIDADGKSYESDTPGKFGGHRKLKIYGRLDCPSALRYIAKGQYVQHRVFFKDEETAIAAGYRPCGVCMKNKYKRWKEQMGMKLNEGNKKY